jgi:hypothetical protein
MVSLVPAIAFDIHRRRGPKGKTYLGPVRCYRAFGGDSFMIVFGDDVGDRHRDWASVLQQTGCALRHRHHKPTLPSSYFSGECSGVSP